MFPAARRTLRLHPATNSPPPELEPGTAEAAGGHQMHRVYPKLSEPIWCAARGSYAGKAGAKPTRLLGVVIALEDYRPLAEPLPLAALRQRRLALSAIRDKLQAEYQGSRSTSHGSRTRIPYGPSRRISPSCRTQSQRAS